MQLTPNRPHHAEPTKSTIAINRLCNLLLITVVTASFSGCMIAPLDGDTLPDKESLLHCFGVTPVPNQIMHVEVYNNRTDRWDIIAHSTTGTRNVHAHGLDWYIWECEVRIPEYTFYWNHDTTGEYAKIRAKRFDSESDYEGLALLTFKSWDLSPDESWSTFYGRHGTGDVVSRVYVR